VRALVEAVRSSGTIERLEGARALELLVRDGCMNGIVVRHAGGACETLASGAVILATGGIGGLYAYTTNPRASRGAGIAMAARAGARLADLEFVQFHPTALDVPSDPLPLLTEALRGEGALLIDGAGARIMAGIDPALELAPRDRVARRVFALRQAGIRAYLDARHLGDELPTRFPTVFAHCSRFGMDPRTQPIPVVAAAHYHMGGIAVDLNGRTSIAGLYACGEVAASGVHGANRLASNSLLESVVYPERIAVQVKLQPARTQSAQEAPAADAEIAPQPEAWRILRAQMYDNVGVDRDEARLQQARAAFQALASNPDRELRDAALVASLIAHAALRRRETRGSHVRRDFPASEPQEEHRSFLTLSEMAPAAGRSA
jgi:L-aspartate oxidase